MMFSKYSQYALRLNCGFPSGVYDWPAYMSLVSGLGLCFSFE